MPTAPKPYAAETEVSVPRTKAEIETLLTKYGVTGFWQGWAGPTEARLAFEYEGRRYLIRLSLPDPNEDRFQYTGVNQSGVRRRRAPDAAKAEWEQACRSQWRGLLLLIRAQLIAVAQNIKPFEQMFMDQLLIADPMQPGGQQTVYEWVAPQVADIYDHGRAPALLPGTSGAPQYLPPPRDT
jgi:hypothetical protein